MEGLAIPFGFLRRSVRLHHLGDPTLSATMTSTPAYKRHASSPWTQRLATPAKSTPRASRLQTPRSKTPRIHVKSGEGDRFIPKRSAMDYDMCRSLMFRGDDKDDSNAASNTSTGAAPFQKEFNQALKGALFAPENKTSVQRVLSFREKPPEPLHTISNELKVLHTVGTNSIARASVNRSIPSAPLRILDAPDIMDDYYLNLLSWGANNVLAVALGQAVYLWEAATGSITHLLTLPSTDDYVASVQWMGEESHRNYLAIGTNSSHTQLWDASALRRVRTLKGHSSRVGTLAWNRHMLSSGSRDSTILQHDIRVEQHKIACFSGHQQEVCGLKWSPDGATLASGGNENYLCLWDARFSGQSRGQDHGPRNTLVQHQAAVKALSWCPLQRNLLASGGGSADRTIKFWSASNASLLNSVDTGSQVCSLVWSKHSKELVSSHGYSKNQLCLWKYPCMARLKEFTGHTARVLHLDLSPDGSTVLSAAADETLRFWSMFGPPPTSKKQGGGGGGSQEPCPPCTCADLLKVDAYWH